MKDLKIVEIKEDIISRNNKEAKDIRENLKKKHVFYLNVMSSPGSGKTTLLTSLIKKLKNKYRIGVIEADIDSDVDAQKISTLGVKTIQMHTMGACHITCQMSREALDALGVDDLDVVILENIGNLVCPAEFDTGASKNLVLLSTNEGDDKPLKYPLMFEVANLIAITKADVKDLFDFDIERAKKNISMRNKNIPIFITSAKKEEGIEELVNYLDKEIKEYINNY